MLMLLPLDDRNEEPVLQLSRVLAGVDAAIWILQRRVLVLAWQSLPLPLAMVDDEGIEFGMSTEYRANLPRALGWEPYYAFEHKHNENLVADLRVLLSGDVLTCHPAYLGSSHGCGCLTSPSLSRISSTVEAVLNFEDGHAFFPAVVPNMFVKHVSVFVKLSCHRLSV